MGLVMSMQSRKLEVDMKDKERILMTIINRIIPSLYFSNSIEDKEKICKTYMLEKNYLKHGDLVFANTTIVPNDFMVGFVEKVDEENDCVVIREIGSERLCNYSNELFTVINKEKLGYEILEGVQYKIYKKVTKAFADYTRYYTRFKSLSFDGDICTVEARVTFEQDTIFEISFPYNNKTSIKEIGKMLKEKDKKC